MHTQEGHRERLRRRFINEGLDHFEPHEVLELLLFYCIPRKDTKQIARALLDRFHTLPGVLNAPPSELMRTADVGKNTAVFFSLLQDLGRYCDMRTAEDIILRNLSDCGKYIVPRFTNLRNEVVMLLCLDAKCKVLDLRKVGEGSVNSAAVPIRRIVELALNNNATTVVLAHNHPSGLAIPSEEDILTTRQLAVALKAVEIELADHIIVADKDYVSLRESNYYDPESCRLLV